MMIDPAPVPVRPRGRSWAGAVTFVWYEAVITVRSVDRSVLETVAAALPAGAQRCQGRSSDAVYTWTVKNGDSPRAVHAITVRGRRDRKVELIGRTGDLDTALALLTHDIEFRVAIYSPNDIFIHAAVVSWQGRAILIPGHSFAGKSTLAAELVRQGAPYYSDEYAVLAPDGLVRPFARRLALRSREGKAAGRVSPSELGGTEGTMPIPIGSIIVTQYVPEARWQPAEMSRGEMVMALLQHAVDVRARPDQALTRVTLAIGEDVTGLRGDRGDVASTAREILGRLATSH